MPALIDALRTPLQTSRVQATLRGSDAPLTSVAWAPDGVHAATGAADGTVRVWNTTNGRLVREISGEDSVTDLAFAPDGTEIGIATGTQRSRLVGPDGERPLARSVAWLPGTTMFRDPDHVVTGCGPDAVVWEGSAEIEVIRSIGSALALGPSATGSSRCRRRRRTRRYSRSPVEPASSVWRTSSTITRAPTSIRRASPGRRTGRARGGGRGRRVGVGCTRRPPGRGSFRTSRSPLRAGGRGSRQSASPPMRRAPSPCSVTGSPACGIRPKGASSLGSRSTGRPSHARFSRREGRVS